MVLTLKYQWYLYKGSLEDIFIEIGVRMTSEQVKISSEQIDDIPVIVE